MEWNEAVGAARARLVGALSVRQSGQPRGRVGAWGRGADTDPARASEPDGSQMFSCLTLASSRHPGENLETG